VRLKTTADGSLLSLKKKKPSVDSHYAAVNPPMQWLL